MTSKEHLELIKKHYKEMVKTSNFPKYTELEEEHFKAVEKDLDALKILKKYLYECIYVKNNTGYALDIMSSDDVKRIKEWLENE